MKFATTFLLLTSLIVALPSEEKKDAATTPAPCFNALVCKIEEQMSSKDNADKLKECDTKKEAADKAKCNYTTLGLKDEQIEKITKLQKPFDTCTTASKTNLKTCTDKCTDDKKKDECTKKCTETETEEFGKCAVKASEVKDFDLKKAGECSSKCTQTSLSEIFDCDYKCNKEVYDALITKAGDGKGDKANDEKDKSGKSSAMTNFGMSSFGAMAVGTILSALLI